MKKEFSHFGMENIICCYGYSYTATGHVMTCSEESMEKSKLLLIAMKRWNKWIPDACIIVWFKPLKDMKDSICAVNVLNASLYHVSVIIWSCERRRESFWVFLSFALTYFVCPFGSYVCVLLFSQTQIIMIITKWYLVWFRLHHNHSIHYNYTWMPMAASHQQRRWTKKWEE